jgi:hypothetical protein
MSAAELGIAGPCVVLIVVIVVVGVRPAAATNIAQAVLAVAEAFGRIVPWGSGSSRDNSSPK